MTWPIAFSSLIGCSFILEEAANPESAKDSVRYHPTSCAHPRVSRTYSIRRRVPVRYLLRQRG
jgi:hypothetical protein